MTAEITDEAEMRRQTAFGEHAEGVAAHRKHLAGLDPVVLVEGQGVGVFGNRAAVDHRLAVVFAGILQLGEMEQAVGGGEEADRAGAGGERRIGDLQGPVADQAGIGEAGLAGQAQEIVPVEGATEAFAVEHRIVAQRLGHTPVGIDIGEEELTAALEQAPHPVQHGQLVGGEIHHAVGDHQIEAAGLQRQLLQLLDAALQKLHVGEAKLLGVVLLVSPGHRQLLRRHVHPHHLTAGAHQLGQQVDIAAAAAAQIQHPQTLQQWRHHQPTAVVAR